MVLPNSVLLGSEQVQYSIREFCNIMEQLT